MSDGISVEQAYAATFFFLEQYFREGGSESNEIAGLLGSMSLVGPRKTADPAQWEDWMSALKKAMEPSALDELRLRIR